MIQFGAAGWRGVIGNEFTFHNVRLVVQAVADVLRDSGRVGSVVVGYDTRFLSERFAREATRVLSQNGFPTLLSEGDAPTPVISSTVLRQGAIAGLTVTAGNGPAEYNGLKIHEAGGVPVRSTTAASVERRVEELRGAFVDRYHGDPDRVEGLDPAPDYLERLRALVDVEAVARSGVRVAVDPRCGTGRRYLDRIFIDAGCDCEVQHNFRDPFECTPGTSETELRDLAELVGRSRSDLGLATDGDACRFALIDERGIAVAPSAAQALVVDYVLGDRGSAGPVARTVATTHLLDRVAADHGVEVRETPCGFERPGACLAAGDAAVAGDGSGAIGFAAHTPDRDGILACLLVAESLTHRGTSLAARLAALRERVGATVHVHRQHLLPAERRDRVEALLQSPPTRLGDRRVRSVVAVDGIKLHFHDSWFLYRRSRTEPVLRCTAEAPTAVDARALHEDGRRLLLGGD